MNNIIATFSIAAYDPEAQEWGVGVQSKFLAAASMVSFAKAGAGAIATQAMCNLDYGTLGLELLAKGYTAQQVIDAVTGLDENRDDRQVGIVDRYGNSAAFTGARCMDWAGSICGKNYTCQGNILVSSETIKAMSETFEKSTGSLAHRIVEALDAAQNAGGDRRGRQAAGLLIVKDHGSYGGYNDRKIDLRVDDDPDPIGKLAHLLELHELYFGQTEEKVEIDATLAAKIQTVLADKGYYKGQINGQYDDLTKRAYSDWCGVENYEERICEGNFIDKRIMDILFA